LDAKRFLKLWLLFTLLLMVATLGGNALTGFGLINPIVAGIMLPVFPALVLTLIWMYFAKKYAD